MWSRRQLDERLNLGPSESVHLALRIPMTPPKGSMHSGWLVLTNRRIVFLPFSSHRPSWEAPLKECRVSVVRSARSPLHDLGGLGLYLRRQVAITQAGETRLFLINRRRRWISEFQSLSDSNGVN